MILTPEEHRQFLAIAAALNRDAALQAIAASRLPDEKLAEALWLLALLNDSELGSLAVSAMITCPERIRQEIFLREANSGDVPKVEVACEMAKRMSSLKEVRAMIFELLGRPEGREAAIGVLNHWMKEQEQVEVILGQLMARVSFTFDALLEVITPYRSLPEVRVALTAIADDVDGNIRHSVLAQRVLNMDVEQ